MPDHNPPSQHDEPQEQEKWYERTRYQVLLFVGGIVLFGLVVGLVLDWYINPKTATDKKDLVQALGLITVGVAGAVGIYFTWRGQRITEESLETTRNLTSEGQITERFAHAIDHLGDTDDNGQPRLEIRLGGIYALERIARDSPERDYSTVMDILTAYVRKNAAQRPKDSSRLTSVGDAATKPNPDTEDIPTPITFRRGGMLPQAPRVDIQAILDVLRRRQEDRVPEKSRFPLDLRNIDIGGAFLSSPLFKFDLQGANLQGASLLEAVLVQIDLRGAYLEAADLRGATLMQADLRGASFVGADLRGADFINADLRRADLQEADLRGTYLQDANLEDVSLIEANLEDVSLSGNLRGAHFLDANLQGANLQGAKVTDEQLADTLSLQGATMPDGSRHP